MDDSIRIAGVVEESIVDGPGIRFVVFAQGCPHNCLGCHNPHTHSFAEGYDCPIHKITDAVTANSLVRGVTFSGGEPFAQAPGFVRLANSLLEKGITDLLVYSGYTFEELWALQETHEGIYDLLRCCRYLVDGRYEEPLQSELISFRGSTNQRIIDLPASLAEGRAVTIDW